MDYRANYTEKKQFCEDCKHIEIHPIEGWVCKKTGQPLTLMDDCPLGNYLIDVTHDPAYYWFDRALMTKFFCKDCQFNHGGTCHSYYGTFDIMKMKRCPLPRLDLDGTTRQPRDIYPVLRE